MLLPSRQTLLPMAVCKPAKMTVESASVVKVTSVVPVGENATPLVKVAVALTSKVSDEASPSVILPLAVSVPVNVVAPVTANVLFIVVVPVPAPRKRAVAAPPMFRVVAFVLNSEAVAAVVVRSPPLRAMSPDVVIFPDLSTLRTVVPEAEAVRIFWSPVSFKISNAFPVSAPVMVTLPSPGVEEPRVLFPETVKSPVMSVLSLRERLPLLSEMASAISSVPPAVMLPVTVALPSTVRFPLV